MKRESEERYTIRTSIENKSAELVRMECMNCGATLELTDKTHAKCPFCGQTFLIDEAKGTVINVNVDYEDSEKVRSTLNSTKRTMMIFLGVVVFMIVIIFAINIAVNVVDFSIGEQVGSGEETMKLFCEDVFGKKYKEITPEEFAGIRYLKYSSAREGNNTFHVIEYSFTNYEDCESEEEFQDTIERWTYKLSGTLSDFTMFTGLTRIDTDNTWMTQIEYAPEARISYVRTDDQIGTVIEHLNPEYIKILSAKQTDDLVGIEKCKNLEELELRMYGGINEIDVTGIGECSKLKKLFMDCGRTYSGLEEIGKLKELRSLKVNGLVLEYSGFLTELSNLEELYITSETGDVSPLLGLSNLKRLYFEGGKEVDPGQLLPLENLEALKISVDEKEELSSLLQMKKLKSLDLTLTIFGVYPEEMADLSMLAELPNLEELAVDDMWRHEVTGMEAILNKENMKKVMIGSCMTVDVGMTTALNPEELVDNPSLEVFKIGRWRDVTESGAEAENYDFLMHYPNLRRLDLEACGLNNIEFVSGLNNLEVVNLQGNEIRDYTILENCKKLRRIYTYGNPRLEPDLPERVEIITMPERDRELVLK